MWINPNLCGFRMLMGKVKILPERILPSPLEGAELNSYRKLLVDECDVTAGGDEATGGGDQLAEILQSALQCTQPSARNKVGRCGHRSVFLR